jgi:hypothetical protein
MKNGRYIGQDGHEIWYKNNLLHREDGPAYIDFGAKMQSWWKDGMRHREDGPSILFLNKKFSMWLNGRIVIDDTPSGICTKMINFLFHTIKEIR